MATYNRGQPSVGQAFRDSRPLIADNFDAADDAISNDHVPFTNADPTKRALHTKVTFNSVQAVDPTITYPQTAVYTKSRTIGGDTIQEPFFKRVTNLGTSQVTPVAPLAYVKFAGASGATSKVYNVTSVTRTATGQYTINFTKELPDANYIFIGSANADTFEVNVNFRGQTTASINVITVRLSTGAVADPENVSCFFWGF